MVEQRILATLKFFDLQGVPLTLFELHKFLIMDLDSIRARLNERFELVEGGMFTGAPEDRESISLGGISLQLDSVVRQGHVATRQGYYFLPGRESIVKERLQNYRYGIVRERLIRRFVPFLRHVPFVRGVAVGGSQAMGQQTAASDIDLFIITDSDFLWIARTAVTTYFQIIGRRRHGKYIANRFCLNHYIAGPRTVEDERDPYNAMEYLRLRAVVYPATISKFLAHNRGWVKMFYPEFVDKPAADNEQSPVQHFWELLFKNGFGNWLNRRLGHWQLERIKKGEHAVATDRELSFHSRDRKYKLLGEFFGTRRWIRTTISTK